MSALATLLGLDIDAKDARDEANQKKILSKLKAAGFSSGGFVNAKSVGEDGFALVKHGEPILTVEQGKLFRVSK
jgi:hypothetical protein